MKILFALAAAVAGASVVQAQRTPEIGDMQTVADNSQLIANEYLKAARASTTASGLLSKIESLNHNEEQGLHSAYASPASGCVRDYSTGECVKSQSFLAKRQSPAAAIIRPFMSRELGQNLVGMNASPDFDRKTQAPLVWLRLNTNKLSLPSSGSFADWANARIAELASSNA